MAPSRRRQRASTASLAVVLLLYAISASSLLPAVGAQSAIFTSTVGGQEFSTFSFPSFDTTLMKLPGNLTFSNNATVNSHALQITPDTMNDPGRFLVNRAGRVMFATPYVLWVSNGSNATADGRRVASFSTVFKINLFRANASVKGEGLTFVVASDGGAEPPPGSVGGYMGLTNSSTDGNATNGFAAVEFDSFKQPYDPDDNHVGLDVNGVRSKVVASLTPFGIQLAPVRSNTSTDDGSSMVWVEYNGTSRHVWVYMARNGSRPATPVLNASLDLSTVLLGKKAYFGFSASTGVEYQLNCVLMWNMTVQVLPGDVTPGKKEALSGWKLGLTIGLPCAVALALGLFFGLYIRKRRKRVGVDDPSSLFRNSISLASLPGAPKEFDFKELKKGTNNFDEKTKLGQGGYGVVYRANVLGEHGQTVEVAVKQFSGANTKGEQDFLAELSIINLLRHRNLVKLLGWCHQNGSLLLVYDFMPNGSLDRHLFGGPESPILTWDQRYKIVAGVASALNYLHHEYNQRVIHRDIKPSNIMLDAAFEARLGDFGLARALESDKTSYTDKIGVPGTLGYIAPECFHTGRATRESDVFGFGAVILEIVSGRRVSCSNPAGCSQLLEGVWKLHGEGEGRILEAVDRRLPNGEFDEGDAERLLLLGLACSHPNPGERPKARDIVQILTRSAPLPDVPASKPAFMWPVLPVALAGEDGEVPTSGTNSAMTSYSSYYASSAGWTTQNYLLSRDDHDLTDRDVSTVTV